MAQDFWWPLLAGTLSAIIAAVLIDLVKGRHAAQAATSVAYGGDHIGDNIRGGDTHNEFHHHEHNEYHHHEQPPVPRHSPATGSSSDTDIGQLIGIGVAIFIGVCAAVLAFVVAWPAILGFTLAFDVLLAIAALRARRVMPDPKQLRFLWVLLFGIWACQAIVWYFTLRSRDDRRGLAGALDVLGERYPRFDDGIVGRATVIWKRLDKVIDVIGMDSVWVTAFQLLGVLAAAAMTIGVATHLWELWGARHAPHTRPQIRPPHVWGSTIGLGLIAVLLVTGPAERVLDHGDADNGQETTEPRGPNNDRTSKNNKRGNDSAQRDPSKQDRQRG